MRDEHDIIAIVVAGGKSSRLGLDKRWLELEGEALVHRSVRLMTEVFSRVVVSSNDPIPGLPTGVRVIPDAQQGLGPIAGIDACLRATEAAVAFAVACDAPFPSRELIAAMGRLSGTAAAVVPETDRGLEPLFAYYGNECLDPFQAMLAAGNSQLFRVYDLVPTRRFGGDELAGISDAELAFLNINEPGDLERAQRVAADGWTF